MRLLFVVQRYGREVAGGAELLCREFASRMAARGHDVEALTSCATGYLDWANVYPPGDTELDGVLVHRLPVAEERDLRFFGPLDGRTVWGSKPVPLYLQMAWMRAQGPYLPQLAPWLREGARSYEAVAFFTYLYFSTWAGLPACSGLVPTVLHPTAHDEPSLQLPLFDSMFRLPSAFAFSTEEESDLVHRRFHVRRVESVVGVGCDLEAAGDEASFRASSPVGDRPYLLYLGRVDPAKGTDELYDFFVAYKQRNPGPLALVLMGDPVRPLPVHPDVVVTGFVDEEIRRSALAGTLALVQPSYFESFAMTLSEAWAQGRACIVNRRCAVLEGQARRSGGAVPYAGFAEFEAALDLLVEEPQLVDALGRSGRAYVEHRYAWPDVLGRYERLLERATSARFRGRPALDAIKA